MKINPVNRIGGVYLPNQKNRESDQDKQKKKKRTIKNEKLDTFERSYQDDTSKSEIE